LDNKGDIKMNNETPELNTQENNYLKMNSEELSTQLVQIKAALESDAGKDVKAADLLGLEIPTVESKNEAPKIDAEEVAKLQEVIKFASEKLESAGVSTETPTVSKMSEVEQQLADKQEKMAQAKFGEQITELTSLDENLDVELVKSLNMATEDKVIVASLVKSIATPYLQAISKLSEEVKSANEQAESLAKFKAPEPEEFDGAARVKAARASFGVQQSEEKTE